MKKIYTTMIAVLVSVSGIAQVLTPALIKDDVRAIPSKKIVGHQSKSGTDPLLYSYPTGLSATYPSTTLTYSTPPVCNDTLYYAYSTATKAIQFTSFGQIFDFEETDVWNDLFTEIINENNEWIQYPNCSTMEYDIVGAEIQWGYQRGTNVAPSVVDTFIYTIAVTNNIVLKNNLTVGGVRPLYPDNIMFTAQTGNMPMGNFTKMYQEKVPLTVLDETTEGGDLYLFRFSFDFDEALFKNLTSDDKVILTYSFKPGNAHAPNALIGTDVSEFIALVYKDPRNEYVNVQTPVAFSQKIATEKSFGIQAGDITLNWAPAYISPNKYWTLSAPWVGPIMRPACGIYVDIKNSGVDKIDNASVSIRPNPATNNCKINLPSDAAAQIDIFNLLGQVVLTEKTNSQVVELNISTLNNGIYMVKVSQNGKVYNSKLVVK